MSTELKPCPFCGGTKIAMGGRGEKDDGCPAAICLKCLATGSPSILGDDEAATYEATQKWNTRE